MKLCEKCAYFVWYVSERPKIFAIKYYWFTLKIYSGAFVKMGWGEGGAMDTLFQSYKTNKCILYHIYYWCGYPVPNLFA